MYIVCNAYIKYIVIQCVTLHQLDAAYIAYNAHTVGSGIIVCVVFEPFGTARASRGRGGALAPLGLVMGGAWEWGGMEWDGVGVWVGGRIHTYIQCTQYM